MVFADGVFKTPSTKFTFYNDDLVEFEEEVPCYKPMLEDPKGPLGEKYPLVFLQYHDRMNVHTQHIGIPALAGIQDEPLLEMNPVDAKARGIADGDVDEYHKRSWRLQDEGVCHRGHRARYGGHPKRLDSRLHH